MVDLDGGIDRLGSVWRDAVQGRLPSGSIGRAR
jgi:hypothetical protein